MKNLDPSRLLPRVVPHSYFDTFGVADVDSEPERFGFVRPLGNDLFVFLAYADEPIIRNVHQEHLDALELSVDAAQEIATENLRQIAFDGTTIQQSVTRTETGNDWSVWIGNDFTSSCLLLPELHGWCKEQLKADAFLVRVPSAQMLFVLQYGSRDSLDDFNRFIAKAVEGCDNLVSSEWFVLDERGLTPFTTD